MQLQYEKKKTSNISKFSTSYWLDEWNKQYPNRYRHWSWCSDVNVQSHRVQSKLLKTSRGLWQFYKDDPNDNKTDFDSIRFKLKIIWWIFVNANSKDDSNGIRTHNHLVYERILNYLAKLAKWLICEYLMLWILILTVHLTVCYYHITCAFQSQSTLWGVDWVYSLHNSIIWPI